MVIVLLMLRRASLWIGRTLFVSSLFAVNIFAQSGSTASAASVTADLAVEISTSAFGGQRLQLYDWTLDTLRVRVKEGDDVKSLLRKQGIRPDGHAIGLFYRLNPEISDADLLAVGTDVLVPLIRVGAVRSNLQNLADAQDSSNFQRYLYSRPRWSIAVSADTSYKESLVDQATRISVLTDSLRAIGLTRAESAELARAATAITRDIAQITRSSIPLEPSTRATISANLDVYEAAVNAALVSAPVGDSLRRTAQVLRANTGAHARAAADGANHKSVFVFEVIDTMGQDRANVVIVCAIPLVPKDASRQIRLTKRSVGDIIGKLDLGQWVVWAEDFAGNKVSTEIRITVTRDNEANRSTLITRRNE